MRIVVFIKTVLDARIPLECSEDTGRLKQNWNVPMLNPDDSAAIAAALKIKNEISETHITLVHMGPPSSERFIREGLALGCDTGIRVWDDDLDTLHTAAKVLILARMANILGFDLLFTGTRSLDTATAQLGIVLASTLRVPCVTRVIGIDGIRKDTILATRRLEHGYREQMESPRPLVVAVEAEEAPDGYASFPAVIEASEANIRCFDLSQIGIARQTLQKVESRLTYGPLRFPAPGAQFMHAPDPSLPAFERRRQLGEFSAAKREGKIIAGEEDTIVEELFQFLLQGGWLEHLRGKGIKV